MANRYARQFQKGLERNVVSIFARVVFAGSGQPTLDAPLSAGVVSVSRTGTGIYNFKFGTDAKRLDTYGNLLGVRLVFDETLLGGTVPNVETFYVRSNLISTTAAVTMEFYSKAGGWGAIDPATNEIGLFTFKFRNSTGP